MLSKYRVAAVIISLMLISGLIYYKYTSKSAADIEPQPQVSPTIGVIDMKKAIEAHPRVTELDSLRKEYAVLTEEFGVKQQAATEQTSVDFKMNQDAMLGLQQANRQELDSKVEAKKNEITDKIRKIFENYDKELNAQLDAFNKEITQQYQDALFNISMKLSIVNISPEQRAKLQKEKTRLETERDSKLMAKQKELKAMSEKRRAEITNEANREISEYQENTKAEIIQKSSVKGNEMSAREKNFETAALGKQAEFNKLVSELENKKNAISALEESIVNDISAKTAKVAVKKVLEAVITGYKTNVQALDITSEVISELRQ